MKNTKQIIDNYNFKNKHLADILHEYSHATLEDFEQVLDKAASLDLNKSAMTDVRRLTLLVNAAIIQNREFINNHFEIVRG